MDGERPNGRQMTRSGCIQLHGKATDVPVGHNSSVVSSVVMVSSAGMLAAKLKTYPNLATRSTKYAYCVP